MSTLPRSQDDKTWSCLCVVLEPMSEKVAVIGSDSGAALPIFHLASNDDLIAALHASVADEIGQADPLSLLVEEVAQVAIYFCELRNDTLPSSWSWIPEADIDAYLDSQSVRQTIRAQLARFRTEIDPFWNRHACRFRRRWIADSLHLAENEFAIGAVRMNQHGLLLRIECDPGQCFWLKAVRTGIEYGVTEKLYELSPEAMPLVVAWRERSRAWLMQDAGAPWSHLPADSAMRNNALLLAGAALGTLHGRSAEDLSTWLALGVELETQALWLSCWHATLETVTRCADRSDAVTLQCIRMRTIQHLELLATKSFPTCLVHNDLHGENLLVRDGAIRIIDWAEVSISLPIVALEHLLLLVPRSDARLRAAVISEHRRAWSLFQSPDALDESLRWMPLCGVVSCMTRVSRTWKSMELPTTAQTRYARGLLQALERALRALDDGGLARPCDRTPQPLPGAEVAAC